MSRQLLWQAALRFLPSTDTVFKLSGIINTRVPTYPEHNQLSHINSFDSRQRQGFSVAAATSIPVMGCAIRVMYRVPAIGMGVGGMGLSTFILTAED
jgi:hypothetical protein